MRNYTNFCFVLNLQFGKYNNMRINNKQRKLSPFPWMCFMKKPLNQDIQQHGAHNCNTFCTVNMN